MLVMCSETAKLSTFFCACKCQISDLLIAYQKNDVMQNIHFISYLNNLHSTRTCDVRAEM
jgi:hypothetical protein